MDESNTEYYDRLVKSLTNWTPSNVQIDAIEEVREAARRLAGVIADLCPGSRERSLAGTHLEETVMWAVKSIVLEE